MERGKSEYAKEESAGGAAKVRCARRLRKKNIAPESRSGTLGTLYIRTRIVPGRMEPKTFSGRTLARRCGKTSLVATIYRNTHPCQIIPGRRPDVRSAREVLLVPLARDDLAGHADDDRVGVTLTFTG